MLSRYFYLSILLLVSFFIGYWWTVNFENLEEIRVAGNIDNVYQIDNKCILYIGRFIAATSGKCVHKRGEKVIVFGTVEGSLLINFQGKIVLEVNEIDKFDTGDTIGKNINFLANSVLMIRNYCKHIWGAYLPKSEASLLAGIILGDKSDIGREFYDRMVNSGTIHIAVASGYNVMVVGSSVLTLLFFLLQRSKAVWVAIVIMLLYAVLAGGEPPVVRAFLMASILYIFQALGRKVETSWVLFLSIWLMLVWEPSMLSNVSFQLSVAASVGLMILSPYIERRIPELLTKISLTSTFSTMLLTTPIIWWHFGRVNLMGLVSNVFVLPLVPPLMLLGAGMLVLPNFFFVPTYTLVHLIVRLIDFFGA